MSGGKTMRRVYAAASLVREAAKVQAEESPGLPGEDRRGGKGCVRNAGGSGRTDRSSGGEGSGGERSDRS